MGGGGGCQGSGFGSDSLPLRQTGLRDGPVTMEDVTAFSLRCVDLIYIYIYIYIYNKIKNKRISLSFAGNSGHLT